MEDTGKEARKYDGLSPAAIILGNRVLYFFTLLFLSLSVLRLLQHFIWKMDEIPLDLLEGEIVLVLAALLFRFQCFRLVVAFLYLSFFVCAFRPNLLSLTYQGVCKFCNDYTNSNVIESIFVSLGFINFSLGYVISARDKRFYKIALSDVLQEQFPEHGRVFVCYACLILIGLYACGMEYHIVAAACLCGAVFSLAYTGFMALLFTFGQNSKRKMVEYYLVESKLPSPPGERQAEESMALSRLLAVSDYINSFYKTNGSISQTVVDGLWKRLSDLQERPSPSDVPETGKDAGTTETVEDIVVYTRLTACSASAWRHILRGLTSDQQAELTCLVLQTNLFRSTAFSKSCESLLGGGQEMPEMPLRAALPLCGLVSYLRGRDAVSLMNPKEYWAACGACLQTVYQLQLTYSHTAARSGFVGDLEFIPPMLFLILESTLMTEILALEQQEFEDDESAAFWRRLESTEDSFRLTFRNCAHFSRWGLGIVCSYKADWFRSRRGMLSAHLTYQRLFGLIR